MSTEGDQSSGNRHPDVSREEMRQRTGLFRWDDSENLIPPWSVPPGLMVPSPRPPQAADESAADDASWPGAAPPAGRFLSSAQSPPPARAPGAEGASPAA